MDKLNIDEVMALEMLGLPTSKILKMDLAAFERLYAENPQLEEYIDRANDILDRQEEMGIISLSCQDDDFPERLLAIGND